MCKENWIPIGLSQLKTAICEEYYGCNEIHLSNGNTIIEKHYVYLIKLAKGFFKDILTKTFNVHYL